MEVDEHRRARLGAAAGGSGTGGSTRGTKGAVVHCHSPAIDVGRYEGVLTYQCHECATLFGPAQANWKTIVPRIERVIDASYLEDHCLEIGLRTDPAMLSRQYVCPGCGSSLEVELAVEGDPILHDSQPAHYYRTDAEVRAAS